MPSLDGPLLKLERANEHIKTLKEKVGDFLEGEPYRSIEEVDSKTGDHIFRGEILRPPPPHLGPVIGDIVHNLRSALDHLAYQLALLRDKTPKKIRFPVFLDPGPGERNCFDPWGMRQIERLPDKAKVLIEGMQPYHAGQEWLWTLHSMWLTDKHKLLPVVSSQGQGWVSSPQDMGEDFDYKGDFLDLITWNTGVFKSGNELLRISSRLVHLKEKIKPHLKFEVAIEEPRPPSIERFNLRPVVDVMAGLHDHVRYGTLRKFEQLWGATITSESET